MVCYVEALACAAGNSGEGGFASGPVRLYRSLNGGQQWTRIGTDFGSRLVDIALDKFDPTTLWATVDAEDPDLPGFLYRSPDRGTSWDLVANHGGVIWLDAQDARRILLFEPRSQFPWDDRQGFWESPDGGQHWTRTSSVENWQTGWSTLFWVFLTSVHSVAEDPSDADNLYWLNSQFVYSTQDRGKTVAQTYTRANGPQSWTSRGFDNVVVTDLAIAPTDPPQLRAAFFDLGLWRSQDEGRSWTPCNPVQATGDWSGFGGNVWNVLVDPQQPGQIWAPQAEGPESASTLLRSACTGPG